jgi:hypothetical protein
MLGSVLSRQYPPLARQFDAPLARLPGQEPTIRGPNESMSRPGFLAPRIAGSSPPWVRLTLPASFWMRYGSAQILLFVLAIRSCTAA